MALRPQETRVETHLSANVLATIWTDDVNKFEHRGASSPWQCFRKHVNTINAFATIFRGFSCKNVVERALE